MEVNDRLGTTPAIAAWSVWGLGLLGAAGAALNLGPPVLGPVGALVGLGMAPGWGLARRLSPGDGPAVALARSVFLSTVLTALLAFLLLRLGLGSSALGPALLLWGYGAGAIGLWRTPLPRAPDPGERRLAVWMLVLAAVVLVPHLVREAVRARSDAWFHTAVAFELLERGAPLGDPYFAGLRMHYLWVYHALVAGWTRVAGGMPWNAGGPLNALWIVSLAGAVYGLSRRAGRNEAESLFAAIFVPLGLDALFLAWFPLKLARSLVGETAGWEEVRHTFALAPFRFDTLWHFTSTFGSPPAFVNKFWVMTAFSGGVTALAWLAEALVRWIAGARGDGRGAAAVSLVAAAVGVWIWHPAPGLVAALGGVLAMIGLAVRPGPIRRPSLLGAAALFALGTALVLPVLRSTVGRSETGGPFGVTPVPLAIGVPLLAAVLLAWPSLRRRVPGAGGRTLLALIFGLLIASFGIVLPGPNTADKMPFLAYLLLAVPAGWTLGRWWLRMRARRRGGRALVLLLVLLAPITLLYGAVLLAEPDRAPTASETELYDWMRTSTPEDAVFLDSAERDDVLVYGPRRQLWGREPYARQWGYPEDEMTRRRSIRDGLIGSRPATGRELEAAIRMLSAYRAIGPLYVIWRTADHDGLDSSAGPLAPRPEFDRIWTGSDAAVFRLRAETDAAGD